MPRWATVSVRTGIPVASFTPVWRRALFSWLGLVLISGLAIGGDAPFLRGELIMAPENLHNHGSCIVEASNGDLLVCWFNGTGEHTTIRAGGSG